MADITDLSELVRSAIRGDASAENELLRIINDELRAAASRLVRRRGNYAQPTSLVNEAWIKLFRGQHDTMDIENVSVLFDLILRQMDWIVLDRIRRRAKQPVSMPLTAVDLVCDRWIVDFDAECGYSFDNVTKVLDGFCRSRVAAKRRRHKLLKLVFLIGMSLPHAARLLDVSESQARRDMDLAKAELAIALVYSLGVVLFELLVGICPFAGNRAEIIKMVTDPQRAAPRARDMSLGQLVSPELDSICATCLQKKPDRRFQSARELAETS